MSLRRYFARARWDRERADEIRAHIEHHIDDLVARGVSPEEARRQAIRDFGNAAVIREQIYDMNSVPVLETVMRDARYACRILRKSPAFTLTAVLTLALAIGVNTAVFSVVDAVLLKPLPYPAADRLALLSRIERRQGAEGTGTSVDGLTWQLVRDQVASAESAVFSTWITGVNLVVPVGSGGGQARHVRQQRVGHGFFAVLRVRPMIGREFTADEDTVGGPPATILSAELWRSLFNADPAILGRSIMLRGLPFVVVGVMPDGFQSGERADLWTPLRPGTTGEGGGENYQILLRLRDNASRASISGELVLVGDALRAARPPEDDRHISFGVLPLNRGLTAALREPLLMLWGAVGVVLLVACVNLAGLLLARSSRRVREIATRMALGSGRGAVVRQLLVESGVLGLLGCGAGIAIALVALDMLTWLARDAYEIWQPVALDGRSLAAAVGLSLAASVLFGLAPALQAARLDVQAGLTQSGARSIAGTSSRSPRRLIVIAQVALGAVLLVGAGLLLRTFTHLRGLEPGFSPEGLVTAAVSLEDDRYRTALRVTELFDRALEQLRRTPGIESAAVALEVPYRRLLNMGFRFLDGPQAAAERGAITNATYVTPDFFGVLQIPIRRGRTLGSSDSHAAAPVIVVSDAFVRTYSSDEDPIGRRIRIAGSDREIVGVVGDIQVRPSWGSNGPLKAMPLVYMPAAQVNDAFLNLVHGWFAPTFVVRSSQTSRDTAAALRRALDAVDPLLPFADVRPMSDVRAATLAPQRFLAALLAGLAAVAVLLAAIGIHGLIATAVSERTREIGIRMALGATMARVMRTVAMPGVVLSAIGVAAGLAASYGTARLIRSFLWGISANDPLTFGLVAAVLLGVAAAASTMPALRLLRLDPAATLRHE
jgi:predicted permease